MLARFAPHLGSKMFYISQICIHKNSCTQFNIKEDQKCATFKKVLEVIFKQRDFYYTRRTSRSKKL